MSLVRHSENRPGQDPQIFSSRSTSDFSNACDCLGKIQLGRAGGKNLNGSNRRTVFRLANPTNKSLNHLLHNPQTDTNQKPLTRCPFFRSKPTAGPGPQDHWTTGLRGLDMSWENIYVGFAIPQASRGAAAARLERAVLADVYNAWDGWTTLSAINHQPFTPSPHPSQAVTGPVTRITPRPIPPPPSPTEAISAPATRTAGLPLAATTADKRAVSARRRGSPALSVT